MIGARSCLSLSCISRLDWDGAFSKQSFLRNDELSIDCVGEPRWKIQYLLSIVLSFTLLHIPAKPNLFNNVHILKYLTVYNPAIVVLYIDIFQTDLVWTSDKQQWITEMMRVTDCLPVALVRGWRLPNCQHPTQLLISGTGFSGCIGVSTFYPLNKLAYKCKQFCRRI